MHGALCKRRPLQRRRSTTLPRRRTSQATLAADFRVDLVRAAGIELGGLNHALELGPHGSRQVLERDRLALVEQLALPDHSRISGLATGATGVSDRGTAVRRAGRR